MQLEITVPEEVPVMTLPDVAFFPQALMPLHIFEPRYRQMLRDVLSSNRLFALVGLDKRASRAADFEPPHRVCTIGIVRACQENDNGTSNLLLQGLCRAEITGIVRDEPYRRIAIRVLTSAPIADPAANAELRGELARLLALRQKIAAEPPDEMATFLRTVEDPETFVDLAAFSLCPDARLRQRLLETLDIRARLELFARRTREEIETLKLHRKLQGRLPDDRISDN